MLCMPCRCADVEHAGPAHQQRRHSPHAPAAAALDADGVARLREERDAALSREAALESCVASLRRELEAAASKGDLRVIEVSLLLA
jgi:hypothetical protein